jgi:TRAP-type C4-dicarboxylate transport system substrate-binding protein
MIALASRRFRRALACLFGLGLLTAPASQAAETAPLSAPAPIQIKVLGGLAGVSQYERYEALFWTKRVPELTQGRLRAEIAPFDRSGIRGQEMLQLMRLGVVPFGWVLLGLAAADEPELNAADLPVLNPDLAALRRTVELWRPRLAQVLAERYGIELLAVYTYPAQVVFCRQPFSGLADLAGRKVRTSSVGQSELVQALGGTPVVTPFAEVVQAIRGGIVECAITGTLSGNAIGLQEVTTHVSRLAISWGVSVFGANQTAWVALPEEVRAELRKGLAELQEEIWTAAARETEDGLACNAGLPSCVEGRRGRMVVVEERWQDEARRLQLLRESVLPNWVQRCGNECATAWNHYLAPTLGLWAREE